MSVSTPPLSARVGSILSTLRRRLPWERLAGLYACVTLGFSQIVFTLIVENQDFFPGGAWFYFWVVVWAQLVPFGILVGLEAALVAKWGCERTFHGWRAGLYTIVFLSFLRQLQIHYPRPFLDARVYIPLLPVALAVTALFLLLMLRYARNVHQYFGILGILAVVMTGSFGVRSGLFQRDWRDVAGDASFIGEAGEKPHIFLFVFDELSSKILMKDGAIDAESFPHFASLAKESAWFPDATTNHRRTVKAIPTLLTGRMHPDDSTPTLFDRLPDGYEVWIATGSSPTYLWLRKRARENFRFEQGSEDGTLIANPLEVPALLAETLLETPFARSPFNPESAQLILPPHIWKGAIGDDHHHRQIDDFTALLERDLSEPKFFYWHCWYPHFPFLFDADGREHGRDHVAFPSSPFKDRSRKATTPYTPEAVLRNYRDQVRFADSILGRLIERLRAADLYDRSILVFTSDHGLRTWGDLDPESFPERLNDWTPGVPLFIRAPGVTPGRNANEVQLIDLTASLLDLLGHQTPEEGTEGVSVFSENRPQREKIYYTLRLGKPIRYAFSPAENLWVRTPQEQD